MCSQSQTPTFNVSSHQSSYQFTVGSEIEPLVSADAAAEFLQVSPRRILELHDVVSFPAILLAVARATCGDSAFQNLLVSARRQGTMRAAVSRA